MRVLVCGAGIGGLAAALALAERGIEARVFERAPEVREVGAGITLWANAMKACEVLGVRDALVERGHLLGTIWSKSDDGHELQSIDVDVVSARHGGVSVCIHRAELQSTLLGALRPGVVTTGKTAVSFEQGATSVRLRFADGSSEEGDVLVGADGIRSAIRGQLFPSIQPKYAGYTAWRGIVREPAGKRDEDVMCGFMGPGSQAAIFRCGKGRLYWFVTQNVPAGGVDPPGGARRAALDAIASWKQREPLASIVEATDDAAIVRGDIGELPELERWGEGRVTLLGDAAHATTPNLGQGGCMAIEDATVLADSLARASDPAAGLRDYEARRRERTRFVVERSHSVGAVLQWKNPVAVVIREAIMSSAMGRKSYESMLDVLLAWNPPGA
jgi:2-polyprenyl-6-methoxyphenol hydroxylase-like FAD-dependent oxidoreductase